ncbi:MAG: aminotransferase class I/II-fold pyridoxal phosphate-dependent enzyme [Parachlamydiaceae bacterium]|nr:aminotransferase class I/II-fold pyridoxal phosphate-dependent enzyme [Parachlamydiaceae bacterium]
MDLPLFKLEDYFSKWEFKAPYLLCMSDSESWSLRDILELAKPETLKLWNNLSLGYTETVGHPLLRHEISQMYSSITPENLLTFAGAEEGIYGTLQSILSPKDHVIVFTPCYQSLETLPKQFGAEVTSIPLDANKGWKLDLEKLEAAIKPTTKLIILNFPHNPTGALIDRMTLNKIIEIARRNQAYIFSDEVYRFLEIDETKRLPPLADVYEKGISLSVLSKTFGLAGLRIGWIASQDNELLKQVANIKHYLSICNSAPSEILALIALQSRDAILNKNREIMLKNLSLLDIFFEKYKAIFEWNRPLGGCIGFPRLLLPTKIDEFAMKLVDEQGVLLLPGNYYDWKGNYFRIGFGRKNMPEALERLEKFFLKK